MTRRYGKFEVSMRWFDKNPEEYSKMFDGLFVVRAESMICNDTIEYIAWSPHFRELEVGARCPEYICEFTRDEDGEITFKWVEQK